MLSAFQIKVPSLSMQLCRNEEALHELMEKDFKATLLKKKQDAEKKQKYEHTYIYLLVFA